MAVTESDTGWVVESSDGTAPQTFVPDAPKGVESAHGGDTHHTDAVPAATGEGEGGTEAISGRSGDGDEAAQAARDRDERGRFAKATEPTEEVTPETPETDKPPSKRTPEGRKLTLQQEIDWLTKQKKEELREIERLRQERQSYQPPVAAKAPEPIGEDFPDYDTWASKQPEGTDTAWEKYNRAVARHEAQQIVKAEREAARAEQAKEVRRTKELTLREKGKSVYTDWDDAIAQFGNDRLIPNLVYDAILTDPDGHRLAYEIATHPELVDSWTNLSEGQLGVALGTLKARLAGAPTAPPAQSLTPTAPPPIKPVGSSPTQTTVDPMSIPFEKWTADMVRKQGELDRKRGRL